jgi:hypothetical protein
MRRGTRAVALGAVAAFVSLSLAGPLHEIDHATSLRAAIGVASTTHAAPAGRSVEPAGSPDSRASDPGLCPVCRSTEQARLAVRAPTAAAPIVVANASLPLVETGPSCPFDPTLRSGPARGPPVPILAAYA